MFCPRRVLVFIRYSQIRLHLRHHIHVKVALTESIVADGKFYSHDYGVKEYDSSMLRVAGYVVASEDDPRINTKNAVNDCIIDACTLNEKVNRYADPTSYAKEQARYKGEFDKL